MNGRKAKRLRRKAEMLSVGLLARDYVAREHRFHDGRGIRIQVVLGNCTRLIYKELKRMESI